MTELKHTIHDGLFRLAFREEKDLRELGGALLPDKFAEAENMPVQLLNISRGLTEGIYNDLAFTFGGNTLLLVEAQSTHNPNIPMRLFLYLAELYQQIAAENSLILSKHADCSRYFPSPKLYVLYDFEELPANYYRSLSSYLGCGNTVDLNYKVVTPNSVEPMLSRRLNEYYSCIAALRKIRKDNLGKANDALAQAWVRLCQQNGWLSDVFDKYNKEVLSMNIFGYGIEDARDDGRQEALNRIAELVRQGLSYEEAFNRVAQDIQPNKMNELKLQEA